MKHLTEEETLRRRIELYEQCIELFDKEKKEITLKAKQHCEKIDQDKERIAQKIDELENQLSDLILKQAHD